MKNIVIACISLFMMIVMVTVAGANTSSKTDFKGHWAESIILDWLDKEYIAGYEDGTFRPDSTITRAEFVTVVNRVFNIQGLSSGKKINYKDLPPTHWAYSPMMTGVHKGYISGTSENTISPGALITREEAIVILVRLLEMTGQGQLKYSDNTQISTWARSSIEVLDAHAITFADEENLLRPMDKLTRAETVAIVNKIKSIVPLPKSLKVEELDEYFNISIDGYDKILLQKDMVLQTAKYGVRGFHPDHNNYFLILPSELKNKDLTLSIQLSQEAIDDAHISFVAAEKINSYAAWKREIGEDWNLTSDTYKQFTPDDKGRIDINFQASQQYLLQINEYNVNISTQFGMESMKIIKEDEDHLYLETEILTNGDRVYVSIPAKYTKSGYEIEDSYYVSMTEFKDRSKTWYDRIMISRGYDMLPKGKISIEVVRKGKTILSGEKDYNMTQASTKKIQAKDYAIEYLTKEQLQASSDSNMNYYYSYKLELNDYIAKNYPNSSYYNVETRVGNDRGKGITFEEQMWTMNYNIDRDSVLPLEIDYSYYDYNTVKDDEIDTEVDHYITLFDSKYKKIDTLQINLSIPEQYLTEGVKKKATVDLDAIKKINAQLSSVTVNPTLKWAFANSESDYKLNTDFKPNYTEYNYYYDLKNNPLKSYTIQLNAINGMDMSVDVTSRLPMTGSRHISTRYTPDNKGIIIELTEDEIINISVTVTNKYNNTEKKYEFQFQPKNKIQEEFSFYSNYWDFNQLLYGDQVTIKIPESLTRTGKVYEKTIKISEDTMTNYFYSDQREVLKENAKDYLSIKVQRGKEIVYNGKYLFNSQPVKIIDIKNYSIPINQYTSEQLLQERGVSGSTIFFGGTVDLSNIPNVKYASQITGSGYQESVMTKRNTYEYFNYTSELEAGVNVTYTPMLFVVLQGDEKFKINDSQELYFIVYDKDKYPLGVVKINLKLTEKYIHKRAELIKK